MLTSWPSSIRLVILDIDGVIYAGGAAVPGAHDAINKLRALGSGIRLLTNDAFSSRRSRLAELLELGFDFTLDEVYTASYLAAEYVRSIGSPPCLVLGGGAIAEEFGGMPVDSDNPEIVVVGDFFESYDPSKLTTGFGALLRGAELIATQRNRFCVDGLSANIDVGFWVAGLEYCAGVSARLVGKPAPASYLRIVQNAGLQPSEAVMVSDDPGPDLRGAREAGLYTVHVDTFEHLRPTIEAEEPDFRISSLNALADLAQTR